MDDSPFVRLSLELREKILKHVYTNASINDTNSISAQHTITYQNFDQGILQTCRQFHLEAMSVFYRSAIYVVKGGARAFFEKTGPGDIPRNPCAPPKHYFRNIKVMHAEHKLWANCRLTRSFLQGFESLQEITFHMYFYPAIIQAHKKVNDIPLDDAVNVLDMTISSGSFSLDEIRAWETELRDDVSQKLVKVLCRSRYEEKHDEVRESIIDLRQEILLSDRACDGEDLYGGPKRERINIFGL